MDIENGRVILAGDGRHARQKLEKLLPFGCRLDIYAAWDFAELEGHPQVTLIRRPLAVEDLEPAPAFVVCADLAPALSEAISSHCRAHHIPVNVVDVPELCSFYFPALITGGSLTVAITTDGKSPAAAALLRQQFEPQIPDRMEELLDWFQNVRRWVKGEISDHHRRGAVLKQIMAAAMAQNRPLTEAELEAYLQ